MDVYQRRRLVALSAIAAVFIIIVLLVRSCGDDEEPADTLATGTSVPGATEPLSQEDYIDEADAICLQTNTAISAIDTADADEAAAQEAQLLASELDSLQTLGTPTDGEDKLTNFLEALQTQVQALDDRAPGDDDARDHRARRPARGHRDRRRRRGNRPSGRHGPGGHWRRHRRHGLELRRRQPVAG